MALFTKDSIERVRDAVDMVELVGAKTDLRRVGSRWQGLCPFHDERTPSFSVNPEDKLYYCFGCQKGGDAIGFVQEVEGLDFPEAVETLAERYNVRLEREDEDPEAEQRAAQRERLLALLDRTARFYASYLESSAEAAKARAYLAERGLLRRGAAASSAWATRRAPGTGCWWAPSGTGSRRRSCSTRAWPSATRQRQPLRPLPRTDHVPARRRARPGARLRRPRDVGGARRRST